MLYMVEKIALSLLAEYLGLQFSNTVYCTAYGLGSSV